MLSAKRRSSVYGMHSVARDAAYSNGAGDVLAALEHARSQLSVYPDSPPVLHDVATLQLMAAEQNAGIVDDAIHNLKVATSRGAEAWATAHVMTTGRCEAAATKTTATSAASGPPATHVALRSVSTADVLVESSFATATGSVATQDVTVVARDGSTKHVTLRYTEGRSFVAELQDVELSGRDAVVTAARSSGECVVWTDASYPFVDTSHNLEMVALWAGEPAWHSGGGKTGPRAPLPAPDRINKVASIVSFAAPSFYHFVHEVLPRLLLLRPALAKNPMLKVLSCRDTTSNGFITQLLAMIPGLDGSPLTDRMIDYECQGRAGPRVAAGRLLCVVSFLRIDITHHHQHQLCNNFSSVVSWVTPSRMHVDVRSTTFLISYNRYFLFSHHSLSFSFIFFHYLSFSLA
jgi:hypothetical protein